MTQQVIQVTADLAPCPLCKETLVLVNGVISSKVTFWTKGGILSQMTPHADDCSLLGKALP